MVGKFLGTAGGTLPNRKVRAEILVARLCLHLAFTDLRADIPGEAVCSDASMSGGGACVSTGLSDEGTAALSEDASFKSHGSSLEHCEFMHQVPPDFVKPRVWIVDLVDGIAGLAVTLSRLPLTVVGMVSCEVDADARRLMRR